ncbi:hypothetical protein SAMN05421819_0049 [Bryocella elongata]|uniref:Transcriptional regulatory protein, C terminal n=1 Tax=Bryocella elongata TaxID=863522 RepID=A0A1H5S4B2_9BACT|nr:hypothetical protein [Bryocella elongata]SEF44728.1 hypothetical protein SAMN05421819_0049 [Bryocella elongata]
MGEDCSVVAPGTTEEDRGYTGDPRWLLVERILATRDFQRSPRLSEFLRHVSQLTLQGHEDTISEQYLGTALFGRSADYDSTSDTIVRSHALRLRRKLEHYFRHDGRSEPLTLIIPRGGYVPTFIPGAETASAGAQGREQMPPQLATGALPEAAPHTEDDLRVLVPEPALVATAISPDLREVMSRYRTVLTLTLCLVILLVAAVVYQWRALAMLRAHAYHDRNHPLWSRLFNTEEPTQVVLGDSGLVLFHATARRYVSLSEYVNNDFAKELPYVEHVDPNFALFLSGRRYTSFVDATAAIRLLRLPEALPDRTTVRFSRDMRLDDFKNGNTIIVGAQEADPWVELFERQMDFVFSIDNPEKTAVFLNKNPQPGEPAVYRPELEGPRQIYAVVAFLPNLNGTGDVLLLEGINMAGTESAVDLMMDDQQLLPILRRMRGKDGTLPHFEMMIAANVVKDSPAPPQVVALHVHR